MLSEEILANIAMPEVHQLGKCRSNWLYWMNEAAKALGLPSFKGRNNQGWIQLIDTLDRLYPEWRGYDPNCMMED